MPQIIDTIISIVLIYFVFSNLASVLVEIWNHKRQKRHKDLKDAIYKVLNDPKNKNYADELYNHPSIKAIKRDPTRLPAYISDEQFASVLIDILATEGAKNPTPGQSNFANVKVAVEKLQDSDLKTLLMSFIKASELPADKQDAQLTTQIKNWYNDYMDRVTGWFKRDLRQQLFVVGCILAVGFNIDSIKLIKTFYQNDSLREKMVLSAVEITSKVNADSLRVRSHEEASKLNEQHFNDNIKLAFDLLDSLEEAPLGWVSAGDIEKRKLKDTLSVCQKPDKDYKKQVAELKKKKANAETELRQCLALGQCHVELEDKKVKVKYQMQPCECLATYDSTLYSITKEEKRLASDEKKRITALNCSEKQFKSHIEKQVGFGSVLHENFGSFWGFITALLGWLISAVAISRGASFWFDNLVKIVNARSAGIKPKAQK